MPRLLTQFFENVATLPLDTSSTFIRFQGSADEGALSPIQRNLEDVKNGTIKAHSDLFR
jgi:hypothetical protein